MVILSISYFDATGKGVVWDTDPMEPAAAMERIMRFVQSGVDVIMHPTGAVEVLLMHRVTGITLVPVAG